MKFLLVVLDGMSDFGKTTPLSKARKPCVDSLARKGVCGLVDIGYKKHVNSDVGYLTLLSCYSKKEYPGRGYLEALGIGLNPEPDDVCIRGNFATLGPDGNLADRRAGRDEAGLDALAERLDGMEIEGVEFTVKRATGHRVVIVMRGGGLSAEVLPNDPFKAGVPLPQVKPKAREAKFTASVLNRFLSRASRILSESKENRRRRFPANAIIVRNVGGRKDVPGFGERFELRACCVAGVSIAKGVARFLDMDVLDVPGATGKPDTNLRGKFSAAAEALKKHDFVFLHINGTDILSHDRRPVEKRKFIERVDSELSRILKSLNMEETVVVLTCDHGTASSPKFRGYAHLRDPVPILISGDGVRPGSVKKFDEVHANKASLRVEGVGLIPLLLKLPLPIF